MNFEELGYIHSCYKEKFSTPRQSGLVPSSNATINISKKYSNWDAFKDLNYFDYIWVIFYFHLNQTNQKTWYPTIRPPRLGGNKRVSVFATRSPYRPNPIGLSLVKLIRVYQENSIVKLDIQGHDLVENTPILDIKPYHPQADLILDQQQNGWIDGVNSKSLDVFFEVEITDLKFKQKIIETLALDPRPSYHNDERIYGSLIDIYNIQWQVLENKVIVLNIEKLKKS